MKKTALAACLGALALGLAPAPAQDHRRRHGGGGGDDPARLFASQCSSCHVAPDPGVDTDRAWIRQLQETA